jgi:two-component sensor histidine kinase
MAGLSEGLVADATITPQLWLREARAPNIEAERVALRLLGDTLSTAPADTFQVCADLVLELCQADSCGISLRERSGGRKDIFRWIALAGQLKEHLHATTPRHSSPCGLCVDGNEPLLMQRPELVYKYLDVGSPFHDLLLIPLTERNSELEGTIWIVSHNTARKFDGEDARVMQRFALFTTTALRLAKVAQEAKREASEQTLLLHELDHRFKNTLAMTASLLRHQLGGVADPAARVAIEAARQRVQAMGLVHQLCSHTPTGDLAEVVKSVATNLVAADPRFELEVEAEPVIVPVEKATVVALISNELVSNAIKHAFPDREAGRIAVRLRRMDENSVALSVTDNGAPLLTQAQRSSGGIGLSLVARLADQLAGELRVDAEPKQFSVVFPVLA